VERRANFIRETSIAIRTGLIDNREGFKEVKIKEEGKEIGIKGSKVI
jgi:hypothetical protein